MLTSPNLYWLLGAKAGWLGPMASHLYFMGKDLGSLTRVFQVEVLLFLGLHC